MTIPAMTRNKTPLILKLSASVLLPLLLSTSVWAKPKSRAWLRGAWEGTGYQIDTNETWTMKLGANRTRYSIEYPSLKCGGVWKLISLTGSKARFRERLTSGAETCTNNGIVVIEKLRRRQVLYLYYNRSSRDVTAHAVMNRKGSQSRLVTPP